MNTTTLKYLFTVCLLSAACALSAQDMQKVQGLKRILERDVSDSLYIKLNIDIADEFIFNTPDTSLHYTLRALERASKVKDSVMMAKSENYLGIIHYSQGHLLTALEHYQTSQHIYKSIGDKSGVGKASNNIAIVYTNLGEHDKAIKIYEETFQTNLELNLIDEAASNIFNIAAACINLGQYDKARSKLKQLEEFNKLSPTSIDPCFLMSDIYIQENKLDSALMSLTKAYDLSIEQGDEFFLASVILSRAEVYIKLKDYEKANATLDEAEMIIEKNSFNDMMLQLLDIKARLAASLGQYQLAYDLNREYQSLKDSLDKMNNFNRISELNAKYESEKREAEIAKQAQVIDQKNSLFKISAVVAVALLSLLGVIAFNLNRKKKMNKLLKEQNNEIKRQRHKVIASINYARRIQRSILPVENHLQQYLPDSFIFFKPRDIVSGDLYWHQWIDDRLYIAAIDCTGHGVPGAFMSLIANSSINKTINELKQREPHDILMCLHNEIIQILNQERDPQNAQDGMDISLCAIDFQKRIIKFAGANLSIYMSLKGELTEIKAAPVSLGGIVFEKQLTTGQNPFKTEEIRYESGDYLFMFTDGMLDQMGFESKKFNKSRFRDLLVAIAAESNMIKGQEICQITLDEWRGDNQQTDDILIIGARLK
ncbi:MAG: SpoIIE family protein phosphatase [Flavobacteriales bacterium]